MTKEQYLKNKSRYLEKVQEKFNDRSYYKRHIKSRNFLEYTSYLLSALSIVAGGTALYAGFMSLFGINDTLLNMLEHNLILTLTALSVTIPILYFLEKLKHRFHSDGLEEMFLVTDDLGSFERKIGIFLSVVSICLSAVGGVLIANEIAGTKDTKTIIAIQDKNASTLQSFEQNIASKQSEIDDINAKINDYSTNKAYQNRQGQILYKHLSTIKSLEGQKAALQNQKSELEAGLINANETVKSELIEAGVYDKVGLNMNSKATQVFALKMAFAQLLIDILLYLSLRFVVFFEYKVANEEGKIVEVKQKQVTRQQSVVPNNFNLATNEDRTIVKGFAGRTQSVTQAPTQPKTVVTQQTQPTQPRNNVIIASDYTKIRNNMMTNYARLKKGYTDSRFENVKDGIEQFCDLGLKCWIEDDKLNAETLGKGTLNNKSVKVTYTDTLKIKYV